MLQARALIRGDDVCGVLKRAAAVDCSPPIHRRRRAPRIHVGGHANQNLSAVSGELSDGFREEPVVADGTSQPTDLRVGDGEQRFVVALDVVRACVDFVRNPRVHLPVFVDDAARADEARSVEDDAGVALVALDHRAGLYVYVVLARLPLQRLCVLVRYGHCEFFEKLRYAGEDRR